MNGWLIGAIAGAVLALAGLTFGFWGFLLVLVLAVVGGLVGAIVSGRLNVSAVVDAARGRRSA